MQGVRRKAFLPLIVRAILTSQVGNGSSNLVLLLNHNPLYLIECDLVAGAVV
jgi:hypothetical protein